MDDNLESQNLAKLAIDAALDCRWDDALKLNKQILKLAPVNADTLNRLARVYMEMGKNNLAKKYYSEAIKIDPYNPIALKNLKIIKSFKPAKKGDYINYPKHIAVCRFQSSLKIEKLPSLMLMKIIWEYCRMILAIIC